MDKVDAETRSRTMKSVGRKDTAPEMAVRRLLHSLGYRYRLHDKRLPGSPDIVFTGRKKVIFIHGCFWHAHNCRVSLAPKSKTDFWNAKLDRNKARDARNVEALTMCGWDVLTIWECETTKKQRDSLPGKLRTFLGPARMPSAQSVP
ncbi:very short patch repair endonuclease [Sphingomonas insulae]|uniref:very short patch repair endonuclease n=1 Tax=Sphingomonas insulae TaxID=424800 RepID=UPI001FBBD199|nr:very short patch repair endonuclease [Sphingomonas insulae]